MSSIFTFSSPWELTQTGRVELFSAFNGTQVGLETIIIIENSDDHCVSMRCSEQCFVAFVELATNFYSAERERKYELFETPRLKRLDHTSAVAASPSSITPHIESEAQENRLIEHESHYGHWHPTKQIDEGYATFHIPPVIIGRIETLASVRIQYLSNAGDFKIMGDSQEMVNKAVWKLKTIEEAMAHQPITYDYLVHEGASSIKLQMVPLEDVPDARAKMTLISPCSPYYDSLSSFHVVLMVNDGDVLKVTSTTPATDALTHLWQDHELSIYSLRDTNPKTSKITPITAWIDDSNAAPPIDPFAPSTKIGVYREQHNQPSSRKPSPEKTSIRRARRLKGATESLPPAEVFTVTASQFQSPASCACVEPSEQALCQLRSSQPRPTQSDAAEGPIRQPPIIRPPFMPPPSMAAPKFEHSSSCDWENRVVSGRKDGTLVDIGQTASSTQQEKPQKGKKQNTMNQQKPQVTAGNSALVKKFQHNVLDMLSSAVARFGIQLQVNIGRVLIHGVTIPKETRNNPFDLKEWSHAVIGLRTEFTGMLTTKSSDASNILNTRLSQGRRLFVEAPIRRKVLYIIECQTKSNERITIEINDDMEFTIRGYRALNGALNWHFVKRAWDAQFVLTTEEWVGGAYVQEIQSMVDSIKKSRSPNGDRFTFSFHSKGSDFHIQSVLVRRETVHTPTMYPDLLLHMIEVQDFNVEQDTGDSDHYIGTIKPEKEMVANRRLWWEVSISSQRVTESLKGNEALELGEKGQWKPQQIIDNGVIGDIYELAQEIVTRIDHIGIENKGPVRSGSKNATKPSEKSQEKPTGIQVFW